MLPVATALISQIFLRELVNWMVIIFHSRLRSTLGIDDIISIFQRDGNVKVSMQVFITCVRGETRSVVTSLINFSRTWSAPVEQSDLSSFIALITWFDVNCIRLNVKPHWFERKSTKFNRSYIISSAFVRSVRSVVLANYLFSLFGSKCNGRGLRLSTRLWLSILPSDA